MLGLGRGGQQQLRFLKAMDSNFTACPPELLARHFIHLNAFLYDYQSNLTESEKVHF
jgi:hypothetical protein